MKGGVIDTAEVRAIEEGRRKLIVQHHRTHGSGPAHDGEVIGIDATRPSDAEATVRKDANGTRAESGSSGRQHLNVPTNNVCATTVRVVGVRNDQGARLSINQFRDGTRTRDHTKEFRVAARSI